MSAAHQNDDDGPLCDITTLPQAWCDHCHERDREQRRRERHLISVYGTEWRAELRGSFLARYAGQCGQCGEYFAEGSWVGVTTDENYICEDCAR